MTTGTATNSAASNIIWIGTYTPDGGGRAQGIGAVRRHQDGSLEWLGTAVEAQSPSFVAVHPTLPMVYAAAEQRRKVQAYRRRGEFALEPAGEPQSAGEA